MQKLDGGKHMEKQIAIITGATGGLGKEFVRQLIDEVWAKNAILFKILPS